MSISEWASIAEIIGAFGLIVSLVFVGVQIRLSRKANQREQAAHIISMARDSWHAIYNDGEMADLVLRARKDFASLNETERFRFNSFMSAMCSNVLESMAAAVHEGMASKEMQATYENYIRYIFEHPTQLDFVRHNKFALSRSLINDIERVMGVDISQ